MEGGIFFRFSVLGDPRQRLTLSKESEGCMQSPESRTQNISAPQPDLVRTGIAGLDDILNGGIPRGNVILVEGSIGTGKTTLGVEFIYRGSSLFDEPGIIVVFEVSPDKLMRDALRFGWDLRRLEQQGRLKIVFTTRDVL